MIEVAWNAFSLYKLCYFADNVSGKAGRRQCSLKAHRFQLCFKLRSALKMTGVESYGFSTFYVLDIIVNENRVLRYYIVSVEQYMIEFRERFSCLFFTRHHNTFKPTQEFKFLLCN